MKKFVCFILVVLLLVVSIFPVSAANDGDEKTLTGMEMSIKRIGADLTGKTEEEMAKDVLRELGMPENLIKGVSEEDLAMVYNAKNISANDQYGKVNSEGEIIPLSYEDAMREKEEREEIESGISTLSLDLDTNGEAYEDSLFFKILIVVETRNAPAGTVGIVCGFNWLDEPFYRCWDVIAVNGVNIIIDVEETELTIVYTEQIEDLNFSTTTVNNIEKSFDFWELDEEGYALYNGNFIGAKFDMPEDLYLPTMLWMYNDIGVIMSTRAMVTNPQLITNISATGWYFHQKMGIEWDVSLSEDAVSLNISPSIFYDDPHQIQVETTYSP